MEIEARKRFTVYRCQHGKSNESNKERDPAHATRNPKTFLRTAISVFHIGPREAATPASAVASEGVTADQSSARETSYHYGDRSDRWYRGNRGCDRVRLHCRAKSYRCDETKGEPVDEDVGCSEEEARNTRTSWLEGETRLRCFVEGLAALLDSGLALQAIRSQSSKSIPRPATATCLPHQKISIEG
jgi:hypothetical protein